MSDLRRLLGYLAAYRWTLALAVLAALFASFFLGGAVGMLKDLTTALVAENPAAAEAPAVSPVPAERLVPEPLARLRQALERRWTAWRRWLLAKGYVRVPLAIVFLYVLRALASFVAVYGLRRVGIRTVAGLREEVYGKVLRQSDGYFRAHSTGEILSRITNDIGRLQYALSTDITLAVQSIPVVVVLIGVALVFAWPVALACLLIVPAFAYAAGAFGRRVRRTARRSQERAAKVAELIEETLLARRIVQAFGAVEHELGRFRRAVRDLMRQDLKLARAMAATQPVMELLGALAGALLIIYAGVLIRRGTVTGKDVLVAIVSLFIAFSHLKRLAHLNNTVQQALASARRVFEVLDAPVTIATRPGARRVERFDDEIRFDRVCYSYGRGPALEDVSLSIRRGETHALVGPSGAGKTTLAMMIPRFLDPTSGRVTLDGIDLRDIELGSLRRLVALVTQETHLFDDTVLANIAYGRPDATEEEVRAAARAAYADGFIRALPNGYATRLGERGGQLSAGQRQRIAIARAFLKDAPILILDEATSALDAESERAIQRALEALLAGRTAIVIAHRLATVARADRIHVLDRGRIVEAGRHEELLARGGVYARLHAMQAERARERSGS
ncbi:MAG: ABC transporter ATP-binding protein [Acidobacteria bacterium]|nr:MAG: ABC transporter ATP-binding protein [Acidobacteriota bacterium]